MLIFTLKVTSDSDSFKPGRDNCCEQNSGTAAPLGSLQMSAAERGFFQMCITEISICQRQLT